MFDFVVVLLVILIAYLYYKHGRVCSDDVDMAGFTKGATLLEADVNEFSKNYAKASKSFIEVRLDARNEYTRVFKIMKDAVNKGKRVLPYKDVPKSPKMYVAFSTLVHEADKFFGELASQTVKEQPNESFAGNQSNVSNLGLQIVSNIRPQTRVKFTPPPPLATWKHIERTRGKH